MGQDLTRKLGAMRHKSFWRSSLVKLLRLAAFVGIAFVILYPLLNIILNSFMTYDDMLNPVVIYIPRAPTFSNYQEAIEKTGYFSGLLNTVKLCVPIVLFETFATALTGYGFARYKFKESSALFGIMLFVLIVPPQVLSLPRLMMSNSLHLTNTVFSMLIPAVFGVGIKTGVFIYIYRRVFAGMPKELDEAATIDGCEDFGVFFRVILPNAVPAITTVFLFSLVWNWNEVFEPSIFFSESEQATLAMRLVGLAGYIRPEAGMRIDPVYIIPIRYACIVLTILPLLIVFLLFQRNFIESVERSGLVG